VGCDTPAAFVADPTAQNCVVVGTRATPLKKSFCVGSGLATTDHVAARAAAGDASPARHTTVMSAALFQDAGTVPSAGVASLRRTNGESQAWPATMRDATSS
jgi:hypothetical protein